MMHTDYSFIVCLTYFWFTLALHNEHQLEYTHGSVEFSWCSVMTEVHSMQVYMYCKILVAFLITQILSRITLANLSLLYR